MCFAASMREWVDCRVECRIEESKTASVSEWMSEMLVKWNKPSVFINEKHYLTSRLFGHE